MKCQIDIQNLAAEKLADAECLLQAGRYDAAYYLCGYTVELLLKARVCKTLGIDDFFDFGSSTKKKLKNDGTLYKSFKVHDLSQLIILSGIYTEFESCLDSDKNFKTAWSILEKWDENSRYLTGKTENDAKDFISSTKDFQSWIHKYL